LCDPSEKRPFESDVALAYIQIGLLPIDADGSRSMPLARFGSYEVRLIELVHAPADNATLFWLELYDHSAHSGIDACSCDDLEEAASKAEHLILMAKTLNDESPCCKAPR
jgi:hypothetical protein